MAASTLPLVYRFEIAHDRALMRKALVSVFVFFVLCLVALVLSEVFYDQYTRAAYSLRHRTATRVGWPATLQGWMFFAVPMTFFAWVMMFFMQDAKRPSLAVAEEGLLINQEGYRNVLVPFTEIDRIDEIGDGYTVVFKDPRTVFARVFFVFRPLVKSNYKGYTLVEGGGYALGGGEDVRRLVEEVRARMGHLARA